MSNISCAVEQYICSQPVSRCASESISSTQILQPGLVGLDRAQHLPARTVEIALCGDGGRNGDGERHAQQEELQAANEELIEKSQMLERQ